MSNLQLTTDILQNGAEAIGVELDQNQLSQFVEFYETMLDWNTRANLTSITKWEEVLVKHFLDSLTVSLGTPNGIKAGCLVDVGSGAGFPGIPLKIAFPFLTTTLVEATGKKTAFLHHVKESLCIDLNILTGRAETLAHKAEFRGGFDFVVSRAVASISVLAELCLPFCKTGGTMIAQKKGEIESEIYSAQNAIETMGGKLKKVMPVHIDGMGKDRSLILIQKTGDTPISYPRRPGIPNKRPL